MSIEGNLKTLPLADLLQLLGQSRSTGTVMITHRGVEKKIFVRHGKVVSCASNNPSEYLGSFLVDRGLIDEATLERASKLQAVTKIDLGQVLVTLGAIAEEDLGRVLRIKVDDTISELLAWPDGDFTFFDDELPDTETIPISLDVTRLVLEGSKRIDEQRSTLLSDHTSKDMLSHPREPYKPVDGRSPESEAINSIPTADTRPEVTESVRFTPVESAEIYRKDSLSKKRFLSLVVSALLLVGMLSGGHSSVKATRDLAREADPAPALGQQVATENLLVSRAMWGDDSLIHDTSPESNSLSGITDLSFESELAGASSAKAEPPNEVLEQVERLVERRLTELEESLRGEQEEELAALRRELLEARQALAKSQLNELENTKEPKNSQSNLPQVSVLAVDPSESVPVPKELETNSLSLPDLLALGLPSEPDSTSVARLTPQGEEDAEKVNRPAPWLTTGSAEKGSRTIQASYPVTPLADYTPPRIVYRPNLRYPTGARRLKKEATVAVSLLVDESGEVISAKLSQARVGFGLDEAALQAARNSRWTPAVKDGVKVDTWVQLKVEFRL